jgi:hypothetical protein
LRHLIKEVPTKAKVYGHRINRIMRHEETVA